MCHASAQSGRGPPHDGVAVVGARHAFSPPPPVGHGAQFGHCTSFGRPLYALPRGTSPTAPKVGRSLCPRRQPPFHGGAFPLLPCPKGVLERLTTAGERGVPPVGPPLCDIPSGCCFFTGPWTVTRSSLRMLRRVVEFCRPLRPVLLLVLFPRLRSPVVGVLGLCWMWHGVPFARQRRPIIGVLRMCWLLPGSFDCFCCPPPPRPNSTNRAPGDGVMAHLNVRLIR